MSTGQPNRTQADMNRHNNEFLENLRLQAKINQQNLEANRAYQETGTLPPTTQMLDTRTNAEKLADVENLKQSIVLAMAPIAEPQFATAVVQQVLSSPLNVGGMLIRWLAQNIENMVQVLKKKYAIGIAGDQTDVKILVQFIEKSFTEMRQSMSSFSDYVKSTTGTSSQSKILTPQDVGLIIQQLQNMVGQLRGQQGTNVFLLAHDDLIDDLTFLGSVIPSQDVLNELVSIINRNNFDFYGEDNEDLAEVYDLLEKLPKMYIIQGLIDKIKRELENENYRLAGDSIRQIKNQISQFTTPEARNSLQIFKNKFKDRAQDLETKQRASANMMMRQEIKDMDERERNLANAQKVYVINPLEDPVYTRQEGQAQNIPMGIPQEPNRPNIAERSNIFDRFQALPPYRQEEILNETGFDNIWDLTNAIRNNLIDESIIGFGLSKRRRGRPKGGAITVAPKPQMYIGFGVNQINQEKLKEGFFKIRRGSKAPYNEFPTRRISPKLTNIFKTIVGGGVPKYNDLASLDDEEKDYLHKIISVSKLEDKLSIPAPSKDKEERDINQFEIMKGEIMAGNDNKEMIKKFKLLIVKLSKQGLLKKAQVNELLEDLIMLGY